MIITKEDIAITHYLFKDDGIFPNNVKLEVFHYQGVWELPDNNAFLVIEEHFRKNQWGNTWRDGVYNFHHYHSTAHEVLGIYEGSTRLLLGGNRGTVIHVKKGDVVIIPAGVAHKNLGANIGFKCVGAYPPGQVPDMNYGIKSERPSADKRIERLALPITDPVFGKEGPMLKEWNR
jgi:uncharacterized protein YjlB